MKPSELSGAALDWAVAQCEGAVGRVELERVNGVWAVAVPALGCYYEPSTDWSQGGPIIDRIEGFELKVWVESNREGKCQVEIHNADGDWIKFGPTPLIAAMRCYVASKLGDEVDVPDELTVR